MKGYDKPQKKESPFFIQREKLIASQLPMT
jgi:hypothetical protein